MGFQISHSNKLKVKPVSGLENVDKNGTNGYVIQALLSPTDHVAVAAAHEYASWLVIEYLAISMLIIYHTCIHFHAINMQ